MELAIVVAAGLAYMCFGQWLRHHRRMMIHRERLAAIEKGVQLPPLEQEVKRRSWNVQRLLLLAGLCWISLGIGVFVVLSALLQHPSFHTDDIPQGLQWIGVGPVGVGVSHLVVYLAGKKADAGEKS